MTEEEYRAYDAVNSSLLKDLETHPAMARATINGHSKFTSSLSYGSLLDCLVTTPELFHEQYFIAKYVPDDTNEGKLFLKLKEEFQDLSYTDAQLIEVADRNRLWGNTKAIETKKNKIKSFKFTKHLKEYRDNMDKTPISQEDYNKARQAKSALYENEFTSQFLEPPYRLEFQKAIIFNLDGTECKALLDILAWNDIAKTVTPIDLKTYMDGSEYFMQNFVKYSYDLQGSLYTEGVKQYVIDEGFEDYTIEPFMFMISSSKYIETPVMFELSEDDYKARIVGGGIDKYGNKIKTIKQLIFELEWHKSNNQWDYRYETYEAGGIIKTNKCLELKKLT